jgi:2-methylisocitrate lyase-like PEP mutase family enzyme
MNQYETFLQLHHNENPLLIGNVWDVTSAKIFERNGFKAVATSSSAIARTMGHEDGENIPFDLLLQIVERIISNISIPLSVDMEKGYSKDISGIIQNIEKLHELGAVGFNIEDSAKTENGKLQSADDFQKIISSIKNLLEKKNINMFINARTDAFVHKLPSALTETIKRIKAYESAGASGIFVPFISDKHEIKEVVESTKLPVNVLCMQSLPTFQELADLGVKRISMGGAVQHSMTRALEKAIQAIQNDQSFKSLF